MKATRANSIVDKNLPSIPAGRLQGHEGPVHVIRFTTDGKYCLSAGNDRTVRLWNPTKLDPACTASGQRRSQLLSNAKSLETKSIPVDALPNCLPIQTYSNGYSHPVHAISINDPSTNLLSSSDRTLVLTDVITTKALRRFHGHSSRINSVAFASKQNNDVYLSASYDSTVKIWDGRNHNSREPIQTLSEAKDSVTSILMDEENGSCEIITAGVDGIVRTYDLRKGVIRNDDVGEPITNMSFSKDRNCLLLNGLDGILRFVERDSGELLNSYTGGHIAGKYGLDCAILAMDDCVMTGSEDGKVILYDLVDRHVVQSLEGHTRPTCSIAAHPKRDHSSVVISASFDSNAVVWTNVDELNKWEY